MKAFNENSVNRRIAALRHALKLTQVEFAKQILISNGFIAAIEVGKRKANDRLLRLMGTTFGVSEEWLKTGAGDMFLKDTVPAYKFTEMEALYKILAPPLQDLVLDMVRKLAEYQKS
ncbi:MAG: helix-turn-helix transcriptional regulator [Spirochaetaceae bacterium]|nr:helix-turn-helix transcriptional regulator [Spirochaetaceae bacterium]